jgi:flagellar protein FliS
MSVKYGANAYRQTSVTTANRGQILLMLYEAAINNVKKATLAIERQDIQGKCTAIGKAHDIINELVNSLNFEVGGEVARNLERLYNFMTEQLVKANLENKKEPLQTIQKLLETLLDGWRGAVEQVNKAKATEK